MNITFSEITNKTGPINKRIRSDGVKDTQAAVYDASCRTIRIPVSDFKRYIEEISLSPEKAIILGIATEDRTEIVTNSTQGNGRIARTSEHFKFCNSDQVGLILLDIDGNSSHGIWSYSDIQDFLAKLYKVLEFSLIGENKTFDICRFERESSSAGVFKNGEKVGNGYHIYVPVKNPTAKLVELIFKWSFLSGYQSHFINKNGVVYERSIIDVAVRTPERLVFESDCTVEDPFTVKFRECKYVPGGVVDSEMAEFELSKAIDSFVENSVAIGSEIKNFNNIKEQYLAPIRRKPEVVLLQKAWKEAETAKLSAKHGISKAAARSVVEQRGLGLLTSSDYIVLNDMSEISVYDILMSPGEWEGRSDIRAPFEPEYGASKAKIFVNSDDSVMLNSFAHGGCVYKLKFDHFGLITWINTADPDDIQYAYGDMIANAVLDEDEQDKIIDLLREKLKLKTPSIKKKIATATKKADEEVSFDGEVQMVGKTATHFEIAQHVLREFGEDYVVYAGSLYKFDKTIWNYKTGSELAYSIASTYGHCDRCTKDSEYKQILRTLLEVVAPHKGQMTDWKMEYGIPCANYFWKFDLDGRKITPEKYTKEMGARYKIGFEPDFEMKIPMFEKLLKNVTNPECLEKMLGLTLCGVMVPILQQVGVMKGAGGTGKGTISRILKAMLPKNQITSLALREFNNPTECSKLINAVVAEIPEADGDGTQRVINLTGFKSATGGDPLSGKFLYKDTFSFTPTASYLLSMNSWPKINSFHAEVSRRLSSFIVEFRQNHGEDAILLLDQKIIQHELPGVLAWMIKGVQKWFADQTPDARSKELFREWRMSIDTIAEFFEACCDAAPQYAEKAARVYKVYLDFCVKRDIEPVSNQELYRWFEGAGHAKERARDTNYIKGIILKGGV